ncbi:MAG TPA: YciI family protein [Bacteroidia bacterium]|nr:YciI family protein [Bacteroidia bacterium]
MKKYFFLKLNPPRSSFMTDMNEEERSIMQHHVDYWKPHVAAGTMMVMGPVMDPKGGFGVGIVCVSDESELDELVGNDPANGLNSYEIHPMRVVSKFISA